MRTFIGRYDGGKRWWLSFALAVLLGPLGASAATAKPVLTTTGPPATTGHLPEEVAFTSDGKRLAAVSSGDDTLSLFSVSAGGVLTLLSSVHVTGPYMQAKPTSVAFNRDGTLLATANIEADTVSMFSVSPTGVLNEVGPHGGTVTGDAPISVAFGPDGLLATADENGFAVSLFLVSPSGVLSRPLHPKFAHGRPWSVAFSPTRTATGEPLLATVSRSRIGSEDGNFASVFSVSASGVLTQVGSAATDRGPESAAFSPDGKLLATANSDGDSVSTFSVTPDGALSEIGPAGGTTTGDTPSSVAFSPDGKLLATANQGGDSVSMFSVSASGLLTRSGPVGSWPPTGRSPHSVAFGPRSTTSASDVAGTPGGMLVTADYADDAASAFFVSTRGRLTPVGTPSATGDRPDAVAFSPPGGGLLATANDAGGSVSVFSVLAGGVLASVGPPGGTPSGTGPHSVAFSRDGGLLATGNYDAGSVRVFSVLPGGALADFGSATNVPSPQSVAFSPVGDLLATANDGDSSVRVFDVSAGGVLPVVGSATTGSRPFSVAFNRDGSLLATANRDGNSVSVFKVTNGALTQAIGSPRVTGGGEESVAFSPDGKRLALANTTADRVSLFSVSADGQLTDPRFATTDPGPTWAAFSPVRPDGTMVLATANRDGNTTSLFLVSASGELTPVGEPTPADSPRKVAFSPDGTLLATANRGNDSVSVYPLAAPALDTAITSGPPPVTAAQTATFVLDANYPSTFECRLDGGAYQACATPFTTPPLAEREIPYTFAVQTTDLLGHVAAETDTWSWRIDRTAPVVRLLEPIAGAPNLANPVTFSWEPTTDNTPAIKRYELWIDDARSEQVLPLSCIVKCSATPPVPLTHGDHTWKVRTIDDLGNEAWSVTRGFSVDAAPPSEFALTAPEDGAVTTNRRPTMSWQASSDGSGSGLAGYDVLIDEEAPVHLPPAATSFTPSADLAERTHSWHVVARDNNGNGHISAEWHFTVDVTPPVAALTAAPNPVQVGRTVTFDGAGSSDPGPGTGVVRYEWDLDGNGSFERDTGATASTSKTFAQPGTFPVLLRVTDRAGLTGVARLDQRVEPPPPPPPPGSVSINDGALYTNNRRVTVTTTWPSGTNQIVVSNDGGFRTARTFVQTSTPWTLESSGAERLPKTVYVRFARGSTVIKTLTDDIILDEIPPVVISARMTLPKEAGPPVLQLRARDRGLSGVSKVQVTNDRKNPKADFRASRATIKLTTRRGERRLNPYKKVYVRVRDRAGNLSAWRTARVTRAGRRR